MKASVALLEAHSGTIAVSYTSTWLGADELNVQILRVVPFRAEDSVELGKPVTPTWEEKTSILRALGELEFRLRLQREQQTQVPR